MQAEPDVAARFQHPMLYARVRFIHASFINLWTQSMRVGIAEFEHLEDGDPKTFEMLASGETFGVFQLESAGMRRAVLELKPESSLAYHYRGVIQHRRGPLHLAAGRESKAREMFSAAIVALIVGIVVLIKSR